jgi:N4-gp56 family major capsid protein
MLTNYGAMTTEQLTVWSRDFWRETRNQSFLMSFLGDGPTSMIQRVKELRAGNNGARAVLTLLNNAQGDGIVGDNTLEGNEAELKTSDCVINLDQWRYAHRLEGRMADQKSVVGFRANAKDQAAYRAADIVDQLGFLTASGVSYAFNTDGSARIGSQLPLLSFAGDVTAPSLNRYVRWDGTAHALAAGNTAVVAAADLPSWKMLVKLKAYAVNNYVPPNRTDSGVLVWNVFMTPDGIAALKMDTDFLEAWKLAQQRGDKNPIFEGTKHGGRLGIFIDGLNILEYRHVYNTRGAVDTAKWGAGGHIDGQRVLLMGAQALAFADLDRQTPIWVEKDFDYENSPGISVGRRFGLKKPTFFNSHTQSIEDHAIVCCDTAI